jgi:hypothetical protein
MLASHRNVVLGAALALAGCTKDTPKSVEPVKQAAPVVAAAPKGDSARVEAPEYVVELNAKVNGGTLVITAKPPLHVNPEYPAAFKPEPGGAKFAGEKIALAPNVKKPCAAKAEDTCETSSPLAYEGASGTQVAGIVQFSVCEPEKCLIEKARVVATVP